MMHNIKVKSILSAKNGMNLCRGCQHGCIYCDSRSACYHMEHDFEDIAVKENALELLDSALRSKRRRCMIGTGSMSDPYMPLEQELRLTRRAAELAERYGFGFTVLTKSDLVLRDIDVFKRINEKSKCVVQMTLTTLDEELCAKLEPGVCGTAKRFEALTRLKEAGIPTVVWLTPLLPYINDTEENLAGLLELCHRARVRGIVWFGAGLTLREGNREYFYQKLDGLFPGLKDVYIRRYGESYEVMSPKAAALDRLFHSFCQQHGIMHDNDSIFEYLNEFEDKGAGEQLSLF